MLKKFKNDRMSKELIKLYAQVMSLINKLEECDNIIQKIECQKIRLPNIYMKMTYCLWKIVDLE